MTLEEFTVQVTAALPGAKDLEFKNYSVPETTLYWATTDSRRFWLEYEQASAASAGTWDIHVYDSDGRTVAYTKDKTTLEEAISDCDRRAAAHVQRAVAAVEGFTLARTA